MSDATIRFYRPSNGSEGYGFIDANCSHCARDRAMREGVPYEECDDTEVCEIIARSFRSAEALPEWRYGDGGIPYCTKYVPAGTPIPREPCDKTMDLKL